MEEQIETIKSNRKGYIIMGVIIIVIIAVVFGLMYYSNSKQKSEVPSIETAVCVSKHLNLYTSAGCSHCAAQKKILDKYVTIFNDTDCVQNPENCMQLGIQGVPSWYNGTDVISGVQSWPELIKWSGCENENKL